MIKILLEVPSPSGNSILHLAIIKGLEDVANECIMLGVDLNKPNLDGFLPL